MLSGLPTEIEISDGMTDEDEISDYLSDKTGYCHLGFELQAKPDYEMEEVNKLIETYRELYLRLQGNFSMDIPEMKLCMQMGELLESLEKKVRKMESDQTIFQTVNQTILEYYKVLDNIQTTNKEVVDLLKNYKIQKTEIKRLMKDNERMAAELETARRSGDKENYERE